MIKRWLKRVLLSVALFLMSTLLIIGSVLATELGTHWLLTQVKSFTGVQFTYQGGALIRGVRLSDVRYQTPGLDLSMQKLTLDWHPNRIFWGALYIDQLDVHGVAIKLSATESSSEPSAQWPEPDLPFKVILKQLNVRELSVQSAEADAVVVDHIAAEASYGVGELDVRRLRIEIDKSHIQLDGSVQLAFPYALDANLEWQLPSLDADVESWRSKLPEIVNNNIWQGELTLGGDLRNLQYSVNTRMPLVANLSGDLMTAASQHKIEFNPELTAQLNLPEQRLPQSIIDLGEQQPDLIAGEVQLQGWLPAYQINADVNASLPELDPLQLQVSANGNLERMTAQLFELSLGQASLTATGELGWQQGVRWQLNVQGENINPGVYVSDWPGNIQFALQSQGHKTEQALSMSANIENLEGRLRSLMVAGAGQVEFASGQWQIQNLMASLGGNQLNIEGAWGETVELTGNINAPLLAQIDPALGGQLQANGQLSGTFPNLTFTGEANAENVRWQGYSVESLQLQSGSDDVSAQSLRLQARALGINLNGRKLQSASLNAQGDAGQHQLDLELETNLDNQLQVSVQGAWQQSQWAGNLQSLRLRSPYVEDVTLAAPAAIELSSTQASLEALCLQMLPASDAANTQASNKLLAACFEGRWQTASGIKAHFNLERLALSLFDPWVQKDMSLAGYLHGAGEVDWLGDESKVSVHVDSFEAEIIHVASKGKAERYKLGQIRADIQGDDTSIVAKAITTVEGFAEVKALANYELASGKVEAQLDANVDNLRPFMAFAPGVRNLRGELMVDASLNGLLSQPELALTVDLNEASMDLPPLGIQLSAVNASLRGDQNSLMLDASASPSEGALKLHAQVENPLGSDWKIDGELNGERAKVVQLPELNLWVSPDITLVASEQSVNIKGSAAIPKAKAVIKTLPTGAVKVSNDVVVLDDEASTGSSLPINMNLQVALGDEIEVEASGFKAGLGGKLTLNKTPTRALYATGDIVVLDGKYEAYGQQLAIERGTVSFQGPLDNPGLNVTATRKVEDVEVGIVIGGTLQKPATEIYSSPQQTESNALSMLFTGKKLNSASSGEAGMLINAVAKLGVKQGQFLADDIANKFGLDELTIKSEDSVDNSQLWLGKYLTKDIYIHYAIGLFDSVSTLGLTYFISDNFQIEAESGVVQSADLIYTLER
ncbi:translocation/assembly module TamB domain-containing protein [Gilvimarinus sp. 1_MG-2023]|uniref:translocation/assembly module TamB domain-containing protein n=1 Tax=Gilvimarinus sp. 1_MG-2023 TaxID=3062638 RepID=UPI0026E4077D|nr:translocation/assembly module TamB domain-containing protein [Gilvimarinus sp. 1_MG-2023]MDO6746495.1 translocation/assembly module TamB domain-containing protein [Gilvimarinus sp. 1_MG-2023]